MIVSLGVLFEILSVILCLHYLYGEKIRIDKITVGFALAYFIWMVYINVGYLNQEWTLLGYLFMLIYCAMRFGLNIKKIVINIILSAIIMCTLQASIMLVLGIFLDVPELDTLSGVLVNIIIFLVMTFIVRFCNLKKLSQILQYNERIIAYSLTVVIASILIFLLGYKSGLSFNVAYYIVFIVSSLLIGLVALDIGKHKMKVRETEAELRLHKLYEQSYQSLVQDIRARQHEFKNHISAIHSQHFLYHTYNELIHAQEQYCDEVIKENYYNKLFSEGNPVILGFLYSKFKEAEKKGINISYQISIKELECNIPVYKMVELVGNLLNNAMDALCEDEELNSMSIVMTEQDDNIMIEIGNQCKNMDYSKLPELFKRGYSEKGENRGYGLYNVKKICEDYQVQMENYIEEREGIKWLFFRMTVNKLLKKNR